MKKRLRKPYNSDQDYFRFPHPHFEGSGGLVPKGLRDGVPRVIGDLWAPGRARFTILVACVYLSSRLTLKRAPYLQISSACWASPEELPSLGESLRAPDVCISGEVNVLISRGIMQGIRFICCRFEIICCFLFPRLEIEPPDQSLVIHFATRQVGVSKICVTHSGRVPIFPYLRVYNQGFPVYSEKSTYFRTILSSLMATISPYWLSRIPGDVHVLGFQVLSAVMSRHWSAGTTEHDARHDANLVVNQRPSP